MILEASFTPIYDVYGTDITYGNCHMFLVHATAYVSANFYNTDTGVSVIIPFLFALDAQDE